MKRRTSMKMRKMKASVMDAEEAKQPEFRQLL